MLQSIRFANHQSFRDEQQLNLMPAFAADHESADGNDPVNIVGVFGANASGKSNVLSALAFLQYLVLQSDREVEPGQGLRRRPFRLVNAVASQPSRYVVDLLLRGERHTYGVTLNDERVLEEWLVKYAKSDRYGRTGREAMVFERTNDEYRWGQEYKNRPDLPLFASITPPTALFLSTAARARIGRNKGWRSTAGEDLPVQLHWVYSWFSTMTLRRTSSPSVAILGNRIGRQLNADSRFRLTSLLNAADFGISDIHVEHEAVDGDDDLGLGTPRRYRQATRLLFHHHGADDGVVLDQHEESRGTLQLLDLGIAALQVLDSGGLLAVDEVDSSLHPLLTARFISLFRSPQTNPRKAQLIFTSHDATLLGHLDGELIVRRDEVWFTEKNREGQSNLYSLAEFKPRKSGENWERRYLNGAYGAVPELSIDLFEMALRARGDFDEATD